MVIAMTKGYSEQTAGAKLCIDLASDWAGECISDLKVEDNLFPWILAQLMVEQLLNFGER